MAQSLDDDASPFHRAVVSTNTGVPAGFTTPRGRKPVTRKGTWEKAFLEALMFGAKIEDAAAAANVDRSVPYNRRRNDADFCAAWAEAVEIGTEELEREAARRAYHGVQEPVFYKGDICGYVTRYSDTLMMFLLKGRRPDKYREGIEDGGKIPVTLNINVAVDSKPPPTELVIVEDRREDNKGIPQATPISTE